MHYYPLVIWIAVIRFPSARGVDGPATLPTGKPRLSQVELCFNFTGPGEPHMSEGVQRHVNPHWFNKISSPFYPDPYPSNIECIRIIEAPPGFGVQLEFRGSVFEIEFANSEPDACPYDVLEIRDGRYGFSPLLNKFCGRAFPRRHVVAHSGAMWLRFKSDKSLEYGGFEAKFEFFPLKSGEINIDCNFFSNALMEDGEIRSMDMKRFYLIHANESSSLTCIWRIQTNNPAFRVRIFIPTFHLALPNDCDSNFMEVYGSQTSDNHRIQRYCGLQARALDTGSNTAHVRIHLTNVTLARSRIRAVYSSYFRAKNCSVIPNLFACGDETCIDKSLVCNHRPNCLFDKDEKDCKKESSKKIKFISGPYLIILLILLGMIMGIIILALILNFCPRFRKQNPKYLSVPQGSPLTPANAEALERKRSSVGVSSPYLSSMSSHKPVALPNNLDLVYSTVVPGPPNGTVSVGGGSELVEVVPRVANAEELHLYLCRQGCSLTSSRQLTRHLDQQNKKRKASTASGTSNPPSRKSTRDILYVSPDLETDSTSAYMRNSDTGTWSEIGHLSAAEAELSPSDKSMDPSMHLPNNVRLAEIHAPHDSHPTTSANTTTSRTVQVTPQGKQAQGRVTPDVVQNGMLFRGKKTRLLTSANRKEHGSRMAASEPNYSPGYDNCSGQTARLNSGPPSGDRDTNIPSPVPLSRKTVKFSSESTESGTGSGDFNPVGSNLSGSNFGGRLGFEPHIRMNHESGACSAPEGSRWSSTGSSTDPYMETETHVPEPVPLRTPTFLEHRNSLGLGRFSTFKTDGVASNSKHAGAHPMETGHGSPPPHQTGTGHINFGPCESQSPISRVHDSAKARYSYENNRQRPSSRNDGQEIGGYLPLFSQGTNLGQNCSTKSSHDSLDTLECLSLVGNHEDRYISSADSNPSSVRSMSHPRGRENWPNPSRPYSVTPTEEHPVEEVRNGGGDGDGDEEERTEKSTPTHSLTSSNTLLPDNLQRSPLSHHSLDVIDVTL